MTVKLSLLSRIPKAESSALGVMVSDEEVSLLLICICACIIIIIRCYKCGVFVCFSCGCRLLKKKNDYIIPRMMVIYVNE